MSKVAQYLNEHILGEVVMSEAARARFATDASVLSITPEFVAFPRSTSDIRKIARFSWQLAEKGHKLAITARGGGSDLTGAAIGSGVIIATTTHLSQIYELDAKQKLVRLQPGVTFGALNNALRLNGLFLPAAPASAAYSTVGGAIANNASGRNSLKYGAVGNWVHQLEVVLASGDLLQTGRLSKKEVNRKKGQQDFEGEIYRTIDGLISDNADLIDTVIASDVRDNAGYPGIADVRRKDGSMDLTPLFIGSQGTLGIVSEMIMRAEHYSAEYTVAAIAFESSEAAHDAVDVLRSFEPAELELIDAQLLETAKEQGKKYEFYEEAADREPVGAVVLVVFDEFSERVRTKKAKKLTKLFAEHVVALTVANTAPERETLLAMRDTSSFMLAPRAKEAGVPPLLDGVYVPTERFEDFTAAVLELARKHKVDLPLYGHAGEHVFHTRAQLDIKKAVDKQKIFKLIDEYAKIVDLHKGHVAGESAEGRMKAQVAYRVLDDEVVALYEAIRAAFDPFGTLNPGVKQVVPPKTLASSLRSEYGVVDGAVN